MTHNQKDSTSPDIPQQDKAEESNSSNCIKRDYYGFALSPNQQELYNSFQQTHLNEIKLQEQRFCSILQDISLNPIDLRNRILEWTKKGIPPARRGQMWVFFSIRDKIEEDLYYAFLRNQRGKKNSYILQIEKDIYRTFPETFNSEFQDALRRVLTAYSMKNPEVGYTQSMNFLGGVLLLFMGEPEAFSVLSWLVEKTFPYYGENLLGMRIDGQILEHLVKKKLPELSAHLAKIGFKLQTMVGTRWFMCLFFLVLPSESCFRVWDLFFLEGPKILFQTLLGLLSLAEKDLLRAQEDVDAVTILNHLARTLYDFDVLARAMIPLEHAKIIHLRQHYLREKHDPNNKIAGFAAFFGFGDRDRRERRDTRERGSVRGEERPSLKKEADEEPATSLKSSTGALEESEVENDEEREGLSRGLKNNQLSEGDWKQLLTNAQEKDFADEEVVVQEGEPQEKLYRIKSGTFRVERHRRPLRSLLPSDLFGELSLIIASSTGQITTSYPSSSTIVASSPSCSLWLMEASFLRKYLSSEHALATKFFRYLATNLAHQITTLDLLNSNEPCDQDTIQDQDKFGSYRPLFGQILPRISSVHSPLSVALMVGNKDPSSTRENSFFGLNPFSSVSGSSPASSIGSSSSFAAASAVAAAASASMVSSPQSPPSTSNKEQVTLKSYKCKFGHQKKGKFHITQDEVEYSFKTLGIKRKVSIPFKQISSIRISSTDNCQVLVSSSTSSSASLQTLNSLPQLRPDDNLLNPRDSNLKKFSFKTPTEAKEVFELIETILLKYDLPSPTRSTPSTHRTVTHSAPPPVATATPHTNSNNVTTEVSSPTIPTNNSTAPPTVTTTAPFTTAAGTSSAPISVPGKQTKAVSLPSFVSEPSLTQVSKSFGGQTHLSVHDQSNTPTTQQLQQASPTPRRKLTPPTSPHPNAHSSVQPSVTFNVPNSSVGLTPVSSSGRPEQTDSAGKRIGPLSSVPKLDLVLKPDPTQSLLQQPQPQPQQRKLTLMSLSPGRLRKGSLSSKRSPRALAAQEISCNSTPTSTGACNSALSSIDAFVLCESDWTVIMKDAAEKRFDKDQIIVSQNQSIQGPSSHSLYQILSGHCRVERDDSKLETKKKVIGVLGPEDTFGEISLLLPRRPSASVIAHSDVIVRVITSDSLASVFKEDFLLAAKFYKYLCSTLHSRLFMRETSI